MNPRRAIRRLGRRVVEVATRPGASAGELSVDGRVIARLPVSSSSCPSVLALAMPKAGSVLLDKMTRGLAHAAGVTHFNLEEALVSAGVVPWDAPAGAGLLFLDRGYCYSGFRRLPTTYRIPFLESAPKALLVRDPRDMLVSLYFSVARSHAPPGGGSGSGARSHFQRERADARQASIDEFALSRSQTVRGHFESYEPILESPSTRVFRYEDVLYDKRAWGRALCAHFAWDVAPGRVRAVADRNDRLPSREKSGAHVRKAHPGDHALKLRPQTIERLDHELGDVLDRFGYRR